MAEKISEKKILTAGTPGTILKVMKPQELAEKLATQFGMSEVPLVRTSLGVRGWYYRHSNTIALPSEQRAWRGQINSLLHEFAHALNHYRHYQTRRYRPHGPEYAAALLDTITIYRNHCDSAYIYPWNTEYKSLRHYERRDPGPTPTTTTKTIENVGPPAAPVVIENRSQYRSWSGGKINVNKRLWP